MKDQSCPNPYHFVVKKGIHELLDLQSTYSRPTDFLLVEPSVYKESKK